MGCEQRVPLWDEMERCFGSPEIAASVMHQGGRLTPFQQRVRDMQEESAIERFDVMSVRRWRERVLAVFSGS